MNEMTKREYIAALVLQGMLGANHWLSVISAQCEAIEDSQERHAKGLEMLTRMAVLHADALLAKLGEKPNAPA